MELSAPPRVQPNDEALLQRYLQGDAAAFEMLYERHEAASWRFLLRLTNDRSVAEDLLQELWFAVAREAASLKPEQSFVAWLYTIARHKAIDGYRLQNRRKHVSLDATTSADEASLLERLADESAAEGSHAASQLQLQEGLLKAVAQLPDDQREAFLLQVEAGLSVQDIAQATGSSFETTKSRLRYARDKLRVLLRDYA